MALRRRGRRRRCWSATADGPEALVARLRRPAGARPRRQVARRGPAPTLGHDTLLGAYLLEPARRGFPFRELVEERGFGADLEDPSAADAVLVRALADWQREQIAERGLRAADGRDRAAARRRCCATMEVEGVRLNTERLDGASAARVQARRSRRSSARSGSSPAPSSRSARRSSSGEILFDKLGLSQEAPRQDRLLDRRARAAGDPRRARDRPARSSAGASSTSSSRPTSTCCPSSSTRARASTRRSCRPAPRRAGSRRRTRTCRTCRCARELGREIRGCFEAEEPARADQRRLLAGRAAGARPRRRRARAQGDLHARRGRAHGDRRRRSSASPPTSSRRWIARRRR